MIFLSRLKNYLINILIKMNIIVINNTYYNININKQLKTCLNMLYYDSTNQISVEIKGIKIRKLNHLLII